MHGSAISAGYWTEECLSLRLHNLLTSLVSVLSGLPSCSILVQKFQASSLEHWVKEYVFLKDVQAIFLLFHYTLLNFLSKNTGFEELAMMAAQNRLKEYHFAMFSLSGFQRVIQHANPCLIL